MKSKEVQVFNTFHDSHSRKRVPLPSFLTPASFSNEHHGGTARWRCRCRRFCIRPMGAARGGVSDVSAENLLKNQSDRTNRNAALAFVTQLGGARSWEAADELGERSALTAAPVNQIINIIQNTATGPQTSTGRSARSVLPFNRWNLLFLHPPQFLEQKSEYSSTRTSQLNENKFFFLFNTAGGQKFCFSLQHVQK